MDQDPWQAFGDRIAWEGMLRVACETLDTPLAPDIRSRMEELDAGVLMALDLLGEQNSGEPSPDDTSAAALATIDAKLDVLLEMFNRHLLGHVSLPPRQAVRFNTRGILVKGWTAPATGTAMLVSVHFDTCVGLPLELPGHIAVVPHGTEGGFITFDGLGEGIRQGIEHLVFRQHRRRLAEARREPAAPQP